MEIRIRQADMSDLDLLVKWRMEVLREVFPGADCKGLEERNREYYRRALPAGRHIACFAATDDEMVGCGGLCLYEEMPSPDNPSGKCAYLMNIYCRAPYRGRGIGRAIVGFLTGKAREKGITKIYLETSKAGRRLYESAGFVDMPGMMILPEHMEKDS